MEAIMKSFHSAKLRKAKPRYQLKVAIHPVD
jgi:hypothetical protein